jgi:hypothetical protein
MVTGTLKHPQHRQNLLILATDVTADEAYQSVM